MRPFSANPIGFALSVRERVILNIQVSIKNYWPLDLSFLRLFLSNKFDVPFLVEAG